MTRPNILFIVLDTLREDYSEPIWAELKGRGFESYENLIATSSWTTPSHASIFTGKYPMVHGAHATRDEKNNNVRLKGSDQITKELKKRGYRNLLLSANPFITKYFGFRFFQDEMEILYTPTLNLLSRVEWEHILGKKSKGASNREIIIDLIKEGRLSLIGRMFLQKMRFEKIVGPIHAIYWKKVRRWPTEKGGKRLTGRLTKHRWRKGRGKGDFVFMNLMEIHEPYFHKKLMKYMHNFNREAFERDMNEKVIKKLKDAYREEIEYSRGLIWRVLRSMEEQGVLDDSLVIVTSDHGQLFGEYGKVGHGIFLYDELLRLPLFIRYPRNAKVEIDTNEGHDFSSLKNIRDFILNGIDTGTYHLSDLYEEHVIAETHGINIEMNFDCNDEILQEVDKFKIAIYFNGHRGLFNVPDWKFEDFVHLKGGEPDIGVKEVMRSKVLRHLKEGAREKLLGKGTLSRI
ncbi:MAG: sulfatase-like hydrolase/transferase [Thermoplasmatota archaeon]